MPPTQLSMVLFTQKVSFKGDLMSTTGSDIKAPQGIMIPVNEWQKAK